MTVGNINEYDVTTPWSSYADRLEMYFKVNDIKEDMKMPTLIAVMGGEAYELLVNLTTPEKPEDLSFDEAKQILLHHLEPTPLVLAERYCFRQRKQEQNETIAQYVLELKKLSRACRFTDNYDENLRDQFIFGLKSDDIRKRLFAEEDGLTFDHATIIATLLEVATISCGENRSEPVLEASCSGAQDNLGSDNVVSRHKCDSTRKFLIRTMCQNEKTPHLNWDFMSPGLTSKVVRVVSIPNGVQTGSLFRVEGSISDLADRFSINLQCSQHFDLGHVAFHIDFRFDYGGDRNVVVRNTRIHEWGTEERSGGFPLNRGQSFFVTIICQQEYFEVFVNATYFTQYCHRLPVSRITHLSVLNNVTVHSVNIGQKETQKLIMDLKKPLH